MRAATGSSGMPVDISSCDCVMFFVQPVQIICPGVNMAGSIPRRPLDTRHRSLIFFFYVVERDHSKTGI